MKGKHGEQKMRVRSFQGTGLTTFPRLSMSAHFTELNISGNPISSFKGLLSYPSLTSLNCDNTKISSFLGACYLPKLTSATFNNAPISRYPHYRLMAGIVFGSQLERVDFWSIKKSEKSLMESLTPYVRDYLIDGWILTMVQPIKMFHSQSRKRRVIYVKEYKNVPTGQKARTMVARKKPTEPTLFRAIEIVSESSIDFVEQLQKLLYDSDLRNLPLRVGEVRPKLSHEKPENVLVFVHEILWALNRRPAFFKEICDFLVSCSTSFVSELLKDELMDFPFTSHGVLCRLLERLLDEVIITADDVQSFFYWIYDNFDSFSATAHLHDNLPLEPFCRIFGNFYELIDEVDHSLAMSLQSELDNEGKEMREKVDSARWGEKSTAILEALRRDDVNQLERYSDDEIELFLSNFFNIQAAHPKKAAAALVGALHCFESQPAVDDANLKVYALMGGNREIVKLVGDISPEQAIGYHNYSVFRELKVANQGLIEQAAEAQNYDALAFLIENHARIEPHILSDAISRGDCELVHFLLVHGATCDHALELAVRSKHPMIVRNLLASEKFDVNEVFGDAQWTALHLASSLGEHKTVEVLLNSKGIDPSIVDANGKTAEEIAVASGNQDTMRVFSLYKLNVDY